MFGEASRREMETKGKQDSWLLMANQFSCLSWEKFLNFSDFSEQFSFFLTSDGAGRGEERCVTTEYNPNRDFFLILQSLLRHKRSRNIFAQCISWIGQIWGKFTSHSILDDSIEVRHSRKSQISLISEPQKNSKICSIESQPMIDYWITSVGSERSECCFRFTKLSSSSVEVYRNFNPAPLSPSFWSFLQFFCMLFPRSDQPISSLCLSMATLSQVHRSKRLKINFQIELHKKVSLCFFALRGNDLEASVAGFKRNLITITTAEKCLSGIIMRKYSASFLCCSFRTFCLF